jgi:putative DNA-invertase from lambdoid prophage Rac
MNAEQEKLPGVATAFSSSIALLAIGQTISLGLFEPTVRGTRFSGTKLQKQVLLLKNWCAVSTREQSTGNQRLEIVNAEYAAAYWFADEGVSGTVMTQQRPQFSKLLTSGPLGMKIGIHFGNVAWFPIEAKIIVPTRMPILLPSDPLACSCLLAALRSSYCSWARDLASPAGKTMLAAVTELERDLLVERTQAGLPRAKQQGKTLGPPAATTAEQRADVLAGHKAGASISELSRLHGVSRATVMRVARQEDA